MAIDSVSSAATVPLQVTAALEAIAETEAAELQVATELEQGIQAAARRSTRIWVSSSTSRSEGRCSAPLSRR
jgi:hypothetical protein